MKTGVIQDLTRINKIELKKKKKAKYVCTALYGVLLHADVPLYMSAVRSTMKT